MNSSALPWERAAFIRARACGRRHRARPALPRRHPAVRVAALARFRSDRRSSRRFPRGSATISRKARNIGPGFDLKRGRGGIREVEFFVQIQQMIHGGRDPSVRAPATLDAIAALVAAGRLDEDTGGELADAYRLLRTIEHRVQMVDDAQTHLLARRARRRSTMSRGCTGSTSGDELLDLLAPACRTRRARSSTASRRTSSGSCRTIRTSCSTSSSGSASPTPTRRARHVADWRSGKARSLRSPAAQQAFEAMLPGLLQAIAAGADPDRALNRLSDIVERLSSGVNFFRLLEARPAARAAARQDPGPRAGARRPARAAAPSCSKGCSTRRASRCRRRPRTSPTLSARRWRGHPMTWRSTGSGGWSTSAASRLACS